MDSLIKKTFSVKSIVALGIGIALFFVLMRYLAIPSPVPNTTFGVSYSLLALVAALFGPVIGGLVGFIGHMLNDMAAGWGVWWSWVIASGFVGVVMGIFMSRLKLDEGIFTTADIVRFNVAQVIANGLAWGALAPLLDVVIYQEPVEKVVIQGLFAGANNIIATGVVGTILCLAYAKAKPKEGSLKKD